MSRANRCFVTAVLQVALFGAVLAGVFGLSAPIRTALADPPCAGTWKTVNHAQCTNLAWCGEDVTCAATVEDCAGDEMEGKTTVSRTRTGNCPEGYPHQNTCKHCDGFVLCAEYTVYFTREGEECSTACDFHVFTSQNQKCVP